MANLLHKVIAAGLKGINSDLAPWDLPAEFITDGQNFRITADDIRSTGSEESWSGPVQIQSASYNYIASGSAPPAAAEFIKDSAIPNTFYIHKTGVGALDMTDIIGALIPGDEISSKQSGDVWNLDALPVDSGTYFTLTMSPDQMIGDGLPYSTRFPDNTDRAGHLHYVPASTGLEYWMVMRNDTVLVYDGGVDPATAWYDISSVAGYASIGPDGELDWTACQSGSIPVINNPAVQPEYWDPQTTPTVLKPLPFDAVNDWAAKGYSCGVIRSHKNYLFALDLTEGGVDLPSSYRWSHPSDNNAIPVSWDEEDLSYIAGKQQLGGDSGRLVDGRTLRDSFMLYSEFAINVLEESYDEFVFRRRVLSSTIGVLNRNSIAEVKGVHYFIGDGDIYRNDGNSVDSVLHNRLRKRFNARANGEFFNRSYVARNTALKEIWFCIPESGSELADTAFVYNWKDDSWAIQKIPEYIAHSAYGAQVTPPQTYDDLAALGTTYDEMNFVPFDGDGRTPLNQTVIGLHNRNSSLLILDPSITQDADLECFIERLGYPLEGHRQVTTITRIYPQMRGSEPVNIQVGSMKFSGGPVRWKAPVQFNPETDRKIDVRTTGMLHCWRIDSIGTGMFNYSGMEIEYSRAGYRG